MKKFSRKYGQNNSGVSTLLIVVIVVAVIVVAGVVAYVLMNQNPAPSESPEPTSTPQVTITPSQLATPTMTQTPVSSSVQNVSGATSLQFTVSETYPDGQSKVQTFYGKNIGTNNFMLGIESTNTDSSQTIDIAYGQIAWGYIDNEWSDWGGGVNQQMRHNILVGVWQGYVDALAGWSGFGDYTYSYHSYSHDGETTVRISNISVNPSLADSLFEQG